MRAALFAQDFWPQLMTAASTAGVTVVGSMLGGRDWQSSWVVWALWILFAALIVSNFIGIAVALWRGRGIPELQEELTQKRELLGDVQQNYTELFEGQIAILSGRVLGLGHDERVSLYRFEEDRFSMVARYSDNPEYSRKPGRLYRKEEGVIGAAWQQGHAVDDDLPDPVTEPEKYAEYQEQQWHIPKEVTAGFKMQSRNYVAIALKDQVYSQKIAVIVFESISVGRLSIAEIEPELDTTDAQRIKQFLYSLRSIEPRLSLAEKEDM